jgi:hypothetical protein
MHVVKRNFPLNLVEQSTLDRSPQDPNLCWLDPGVFLVSTLDGSHDFTSTTTLVGFIREKKTFPFSSEHRYDFFFFKFIIHGIYLYMIINRKLEHPVHGE